MYSSWPYWNEYGDTLALLDVKGKTVIDVGADSGSSVAWFLLHGASKVIAYEVHPELQIELKNNFGNDERVQIHSEWIGGMPVGDVFKIDCEGCEIALQEEHLINYKSWLVAVHSWTHNRKLLLGWIDKHGGRKVWTTPDGLEEVFVK